MITRLHQARIDALVCRPGSTDGNAKAQRLKAYLPVQRI